MHQQGSISETEDARIKVQERLLELAGVYRDLNRKELAHALRRDGSKLVPSTGNPKLDYLVSLAEVLDWPVGEVADVIWSAGETPDDSDPEASFETLDTEARDAHRDGDYERMHRLAVRMAAVAGTPDERALATLREGGAWDGRGRYTKQLECVRRGLQEGPIAPELRLLLQVNLANAHYTLGALFEARALAVELISLLGEEPPEARRTRATQAFVHYVLGNASRQLIAQQPDCSRQCAGDALAALRKAADLYTALADEFDHAPWYGIANTCRGGILEAEVELGERTATEALDAIREGLGASDPELAGDRLESLGWWCIFGCTIALRHTDGRDRQQQMSCFLSRGFEIASRLGNWSMRERLFTLEFLQRQHLNELAGIPVDWTIAATDVRVLVGTMGRFPSFRSTGWRILESAKPIDPGRGN